MPEKRFLLEPCLAKVSGSDHLGDLVLSLKPDVHVFGHTHIPIDIDLDGTYHVQWPLGSPREQSRQCARAKALGPLELFRTDVCRNQIIATRLSQHGRVFAQKGLSEELSGAPDSLVDLCTGSNRPIKE